MAQYASKTGEVKLSLNQTLSIILPINQDFLWNRVFMQRLKYGAIKGFGPHPIICRKNPAWSDN